MLTFHQNLINLKYHQKISRNQASFFYLVLFLNLKGLNMKLVIAVIQPFKLEEVREALTDMGIQGLMVSEVQGYGRQSGHTEIYRGAEYTVNFVPKVKIEIVAKDKEVPNIVEKISLTAKTGKIGDGKIFVVPVDSALRIRTDETGEDAI